MNRVPHDCGDSHSGTKTGILRTCARARQLGAVSFLEVSPDPRRRQARLAVHKLQSFRYVLTNRGCLDATIGTTYVNGHRPPASRRYCAIFQGGRGCVNRRVGAPGRFIRPTPRFYAKFPCTAEIASWGTSKRKRRDRELKTLAGANAL